MLNERDPKPNNKKAIDIKYFGLILLLENPIISLLVTSANAIIAIENPAKERDTLKLVNAGI